MGEQADAAFLFYTSRAAEFARVCSVRLNERSAAMLTGARAIKVKVALSETGACVG
jgi:hypothetical protein